jgi:hypothetical protein
MVIAAVNARFCSPPLDDDEVEQITKSAIGYRLKHTESDIAEIEGEVVESQESGEVIPEGNGMRLTIIQTDPVEYVLHCPAWARWNGTGNVNLTHKEIYSAENLPEVIARQIPQVCLENYPGSFSDVWAGLPASKKGPAVEGLLSILIRDAVENGRVVQGSAFGHEACELLRYLVEALESAAPCGQEGTPAAEGDPTKMPDGTIWFIWGEVIREITAVRKLAEGSARAMRKAVERVLGDRGMKSAQHRYNGVRRLYTKITVDEVQSLRAAAYDGIEEGEEIRPAVMAPAAGDEVENEPAGRQTDWQTEFLDPFA